MTQREQATDGRTEALEFLYEGAPVDLSVALTSVRENVKINVRERIAMGRKGVIQTADVQGVELSFDMSDVTADFENIKSDYATKVEARIRPDITVVRTVFYPSTGQRLLKTYRDGTFQSFPRSGGTGGQDSTYAVTVSFGQQPETEAA